MPEENLEEFWTEFNSEEERQNSLNKNTDDGLQSQDYGFEGQDDGSLDEEAEFSDEEFLDENESDGISDIDLDAQLNEFLKQDHATAANTKNHIIDSSFNNVSGAVKTTINENPRKDITFGKVNTVANSSVSKSVGSAKSDTKKPPENAGDKYKRGVADNIAKLYGQKPRKESFKSYSIPPELQTLLNANADAKKFFELLHTGQKKAYCEYITEKELLRSTRANRVLIMLKNKQYTLFSKSFQDKNKD